MHGTMADGQNACPPAVERTQARRPRRPSPAGRGVRGQRRHYQRHRLFCCPRQCPPCRAHCVTSASRIRRSRMGRRRPAGRRLRGGHVRPRHRPVLPDDRGAEASRRHVQGSDRGIRQALALQGAPVGRFSLREAQHWIRRSRVGGISRAALLARVVRGQ